MRWVALALGLGGCIAPGPPPDLPPDVLDRLMALSPAELPAARPDVTNRFADDPRAAVLGQQLFFDARFSGPLLEDDENGGPGTLGLKGEAGRVSCASCHVATTDFADSRSTRGQLSLAAGWTRRRTPSLFDLGQTTLLMWDGRRDTAYSQPFGVIESPLEFNSSPLFVAQQIARYYRADYQALFGSLPVLAYDEIIPTDAGCAESPADPVHDRCQKPGQDDDDVTRVVVNLGKALDAYERLLECGSSRFDAWMHGAAGALSVDEQAGAVVFVRAGCDHCHSGPDFSDQQFHNVGATNLQPIFIEPFDDPGAGPALTALLADRLNSRGPFSDGYDGRLDGIPQDTLPLVGAFRTPALRCVSGRRSFMHAGQLRSLEDVVLFFDRGGDSFGYQGMKDPLVVPLGLTEQERAQLVAFLRALDGPGPDASLTARPALPGE